MIQMTLRENIKVFYIEFFEIFLESSSFSPFFHTLSTQLYR